jgi:hypothetical protein
MRPGIPHVVLRSVIQTSCLGILFLNFDADPERVLKFNPEAMAVALRKVRPSRATQ